jgi:hypothetical protein
MEQTGGTPYKDQVKKISGSPWHAVDIEGSRFRISVFCGADSGTAI